MSWRRWFILISMLVLGALLVSACSGQTTPEATKSPAAEQQVNADEHTDEHAAEAATQVAEETAQAEEHGEEHTTEAEEHGEEHAAEAEEHEHEAVPAEYAELTNPFAGDADAIAAGAELYQSFCASCHGTEGRGDGPAAESLQVKPANLADADMMAGVTDGYLFWRISQGMMSEGMEDSSMPAFGHMLLSEEEIWQVISFVRTLSASQ